MWLSRVLHDAPSFFHCAADNHTLVYHTYKLETCTCVCQHVLSQGRYCPLLTTAKTIFEVVYSVAHWPRRLLLCFGGRHHNHIVVFAQPLQDHPSLERLLYLLCQLVLVEFLTLNSRLVFLWLCNQFYVCTDR